MRASDAAVIQVGHSLYMRDAKKSIIECSASEGNASPVYWSHWTDDRYVVLQ